MNYGPDGSGMYNHKGAYTLATYFGYNPATTYLFRDSLPEDFDWNGTLVNHLDQNIPLYYAGWSDYEFIGGHAFIFDGYSDSTHYHINWGWGGSADGYFYINNLTPSGNNFTLLHEVIVNAVPSTEPTYCNGLKTLNTIEGIIEDGSGPLDFYQNDADCEWLISPQDSVSGITLEFLKLVMDDEDYIIIYNGNSSSSPILETIYGSDNPTIIESTSDKVFIKFVSNADSVNDGWLLSYAGIKPKYCLLSDTFTAITDTIVDGSNSYQYQNNTFCNWYIQPAEAQSIRISFLEFDIEPVNDFVKIVNSSNQTVATLSGSVIPDPVTIIGDKATVTFRSNTSSRNNGFKLYYEINKDAIDQNKIAKVSLFPNPAEDQIFIDLSNISGATKIKIINCDGKICNEQIIDTQNNTLQNIDISELSAGLYIVVIENNQYVGRLKMVKKK
jgi:hypothetical protein